MNKIFTNRFSCRAYDTSRLVEPDKLREVLEAARLAPSATNRQPWTFLLVDDPSGRRAISEAYPRPWIDTAPMFIVVFGHHDEAWHRPADGKDHTDIDVAIAIEHICLAAADCGLATCWVCNFDPTVIRAAFNAPEALEPIAIIPIGYPISKTEIPSKSRKPLEQIVKRNKL